MRTRRLVLLWPSVAGRAGPAATPGVGTTTESKGAVLTDAEVVLVSISTIEQLGSAAAGLGGCGSLGATQDVCP